MTFYVNNQPHESVDSKTLAQTLSDLQLTTQRGIAVAVNNTVIPKAEWITCSVQHDDHITIIRATQGG